MDASQEIAERKKKYARVEYHTDETGRVIGVQRLTPSQQLRITELTSGLDGVVEIIDDDPNSKTYGQVFKQPKRMPISMAAAVREIDGVKIPFPTTRAQLDSILDRLDQEGVQAAGIALMKFNPSTQEAPTNPDGTPETAEQAAEREANRVRDAAKN